MRILVEILEYDFEINYVLGGRNYIQNVLSQLPKSKKVLSPYAKYFELADTRESLMILEIDAR
jgi:hypothetical protein